MRAARSGYGTLLTFVACLTFAGPGRADMLPMPTIHELCREAELIVDAEHLGGDRVKVLRVIKAPGDFDRTTAVLDLEAFGRIDRRVARFRREAGVEIGTRTAVLFLRPSRDGKGWAAYYTSGHEGRWGSPGVYWYDVDACYGYQQTDNPGPYMLQAGKPNTPWWDVPPDEAALRERMNVGLAMNAEWEEVLALPDPAARADRLARYLLPRTAPAGYTGAFRRELHERMAELGESAVPALLRVLSSAGPDDDLNEAVRVLCAIGSVARFRHKPSPTPVTLPALRRLLGDPGKTSRYYVVCAMRSTFDPAALPDVRALLRDADPQVAKEAAETVKVLEAEERAARDGHGEGRVTGEPR